MRRWLLDPLARLVTWGGLALIVGAPVLMAAGYLLTHRHEGVYDQLMVAVQGGLATTVLWAMLVSGFR